MPLLTRLVPAGLLAAGLRRSRLIPTAQCPDMFAWLVPFAALRC